MFEYSVTAWACTMIAVEIPVPKKGTLCLRPEERMVKQFGQRVVQMLLQILGEILAFNYWNNRK